MQRPMKTFKLRGLHWGMSLWLLGGLAGGLLGCMKSNVREGSTEAGDLRGELAQLEKRIAERKVLLAGGASAVQAMGGTSASAPPAAAMSATDLALAKRCDGVCQVGREICTFSRRICQLAADLGDAAATKSCQRSEKDCADASSTCSSCN